MNDPQSPPKPLTTTSHAVLGLLALKPWTTYELARQVQRSLGWFWPRAERKLYDEPKHLVAAGLATATAQQTGRRPRTMYAITAAGRKALRSWLGEPPDVHLALWHGFSGALALSSLIVAGGATLFVARGAVERAQARVPRVGGAQRAYDGAVRASDDRVPTFQRRLR